MIFLGNSHSRFVPSPFYVKKQHFLRGGTIFAVFVLIKLGKRVVPKLYTYEAGFDIDIISPLLECDSTNRL